MALDSGLNAMVTKTELDEVLDTSYSEPDTRWGFAHAFTTDLFKQENLAEGNAFLMAEHMGPGLFESTGENEEPTEASPRTANKMTIEIVDYTKDLPISKDFNVDDKHGVVQQDVRRMGQKAKTTQDKYAFDTCYAGGFDATLTPDAAYLWSDSHTNLNGDTIDNLATGALTPDNLEVLIRKLYEQKDQSGDLGGHGAAALLVPPALMKKALAYTESELEPNVADNNRNYISIRFDSIRVYENPYVGGTFNDYSNANTAYYLVSPEHKLTRKIRQALSTVMVPWQFDKKRRWMYRVDYRETYYAGTWEGAVASTGTV